MWKLYRNQCNALTKHLLEYVCKVPISPILFSIYVNEITVKWNQVYTKALVYQPVQYKHSTLCSQVITADCTDNLKRGGIHIQNIENNLGLVPPENSETMAFLGHDPVRCTVTVASKCLQPVMNFKCLGYEISCENKRRINKTKQNLLKCWEL